MLNLEREGLTLNIRGGVEFRERCREGEIVKIEREGWGWGLSLTGKEDDV